MLALPDTEAEAIRRYTFSDADLAIIAQHRGPANRLGFAVQLCYMRHPGVVLAAGDAPPRTLLQLVAEQLKVSQEHWAAYGKREQTRREHLVELQTVFGFQPFAKRHYRTAVHGLEELAWQTDKGVVLAAALVELATPPPGPRQVLPLKNPPCPCLSTIVILKAVELDDQSADEQSRHRAPEPASAEATVFSYSLLNRRH